MSNLVVTCPKGFWREWIAEGDPAGAPWSGETWGWYMGGRRPPIEPGDRLYVVAWGRLRGWAPVTQLRGHWVIERQGGGVACTIAESIPGFRGWRYQWWDRAAELSFPDWQTAGIA